MPPACEFADSLRVKLEKNEEEPSFGLAGRYGSDSSCTSDPAVLLGDGVCGPFDTCRVRYCCGVGPGRSGVDENFELRLFIHDDRFEPGFPLPS